MSVTKHATDVAQMKRWASQAYANGEMRVEVALPTSRTQLVQLTPAKDADGDAVVFIWSMAGDMRAASQPAKLLELNAQLTYGRVAIHQSQVKVMHALHDSSATMAEVGKTIYYVAKAADEIEQGTYGAGSDTL